MFYSWRNFIPNLDRYPRWLVETETPLILLALGRALGGAQPVDAVRPETTLRRDHVWLLLAFSAVVFLSYLFYVPWGRDEWGYLRFVLPSYPALLVLSVAVAIEALKRVPGGKSVWVGLSVVLYGALATWQARDAVRRGAFATAVTEERYVDVGRYIAAVMPSNAIFIAGAEIREHPLLLESDHGSLRLAGSAEWLDRAVNTLRQKGYHPYFALEEGEEAAFRDRFRKRNLLARLDWPATAERSEPIRVRIYDPADRERFLSGEPMVTGDIGLTKKPTLTVK